MSAEHIRPRFWLILSFVVILVLSVSACKVEPTEQGTLEPSPLPLTPYNTLTPTQSPDTNSGESSLDLASTQPPSPTATPFIYLIQSGDTLLPIAQRYNITLDELLAANPDIDPNFLIVGNEVIIPTGDGSLAAFPIPTPISVDMDQPSCYPTADGGLWCLVMAKNPHSGTLENVSAQITLFTPQGEQVDQQVAIAPLNVVFAGEAIPLAVFFPKPIPEKISARAELITALPIEPDSERYIDFSIYIDKSELAGRFGEVEGSVLIEEEAQPANQIWLVAAAFDANGQPIGLRKWESKRELAPGESLNFHISVYSLGPQIAEIRVLGEARP
ncbi:MAG: LysM peptidoglycan-binding domain-containing protein [Anaerolineales bacterium]|nr:LysM peptidoglycan-binding domain-containing protein [Chloroflexota bacterium]MBL7163727.1 LysM peptidoglycan-binding domain-containing protein [Anaerolineales bacterium]